MQHPGEYTSTVQTPPLGEKAAVTGSDTASDKFKQTYEDASRRAAEATRAAEDKATDLGHSIGDTLSHAYHAVADPVVGAVHTAEEKTKWAVEHTKVRDGNGVCKLSLC